MSFIGKLNMDLWKFVQTSKFHQITGLHDQWFFLFQKLCYSTESYEHIVTHDSSIEVLYIYWHWSSHLVIYMNMNNQLFIVLKCMFYFFKFNMGIMDKLTCFDGKWNHRKHWKIKNTIATSPKHFKICHRLIFFSFKHSCSLLHFPFQFHMGADILKFHSKCCLHIQMI